MFLTSREFREAVRRDNRAVVRRQNKTLNGCTRLANGVALVNDTVCITQYVEVAPRHQDSYIRDVYFLLKLLLQSKLYSRHYILRVYQCFTFCNFYVDREAVAFNTRISTLSLSVSNTAQQHLLNQHFIFHLLKLLSLVGSQLRFQAVNITLYIMQVRNGVTSDNSGINYQLVFIGLSRGCSRRLTRCQNLQLCFTQVFVAYRVSTSDSLNIEVGHDVLTFQVLLIHLTIEFLNEQAVYLTGSGDCNVGQSIRCRH